MLHKQRQMIHKSSQEFLKKLLDRSVHDRHPTREWSEWFERHRVMGNDTFELNKNKDNNDNDDRARARDRRPKKRGFKMPRFIGLGNRK